MVEAVEKAKADTKAVATKKHLIAVTGDKGGTGKSTWSRGMVDLLASKTVQCAAYDSDKRNAQLYRYYKDFGDGVKRIDIGARGGADALLDDMEAVGAKVMLVDLPAGGNEAFEKLEAEMGLLESAKELGYGITIVSVLSRVKDSVNALKLLMDFAGDAVGYVAVKNLYFGDAEKFRILDNSKTRKQLEQYGGIVITMPDLYDDTFELLDENNLTFRAAVGESSPLSRSHRSRIYQWLKHFEVEVMKTGALLGAKP